MKNYFTPSLMKAIFTSTFLTVLLFGNMFAQQKLISSKQIMPSLASIEEYNFSKDPQLMINGCDTVNYAKGFVVPKQWTAFNWGAALPSTGYVHGTNSLGDKEKGNYIDLTSFSTATHITGTFIWFTDCYSANPNQTVSVNVYDNSGTAGAPGALLGSQTLTMSAIMYNISKGYLTRVVFSSPIAIPASKKVYVTCDYSNLVWTNAPGTDSLSIVASDTLQENPGIVWEKTSADIWHPLDDGTSWNLKKAGLFIFPFITSTITPPSAVLTVTPSNATICTGQNITFDPTGSVSSYGSGWFASPGYSSANFSGQNLVMTYTVANTYTVGYNAKACGVISTASVLVTVNPSPTLTASSNSPVCEGAQLQLSATSNVNSFSWMGPNSFTSISQNPTISLVTSANNGTYSVTATHSNTCTNTQLVNVTINPCTGIDQIENAEGITILQNDNQQFFLVMDNNKDVKISIFNIAGELMSSAMGSGAERVELNTFSLLPGMYFVQVNSAERAFTKKIIITR